MLWIQRGEGVKGKPDNEFIPSLSEHLLDLCPVSSQLLFTGVIHSHLQLLKAVLGTRKPQ